MINLSNLKICFVAGTLGQGGAERQLYYILRTLKESEIHLRLLSLTQGEFWEASIRELGVTITWIGKYNSPLMRLKAIIQELRDDPPDILQSQHFYTNLYVALAARYLGCQEIGAVRNDGIKEIQANGLIGGYGSAFLPRILAANSRKAIENLSTIGVPAHRIVFVPNMLDKTEFPRKNIQATRKTINILAIGRLVEQKRFDRLINLAKLSTEWNYPVHFTIVGEGPERQNLKTMACNLGINHLITFLGEVTNLHGQYQSADIFVLTSDWEGTPNVILEAMAYELPVVATQVGGIPEIIRDGETGYLVAPEDINGLARSVLKLIQNEKDRIRMGELGRAFIEENYTQEQLIISLKNLYQRVLN